MMFRWKAALFGGSAVVAISAGALAQNPPQSPTVQLPAPAAGQAPLYDPQQLPAQCGQVQQFTLTPRGDIDGLILSDGTEVKTPPHLSTESANALNSRRIVGTENPGPLAPTSWWSRGDSNLRPPTSAGAGARALEAQPLPVVQGLLPRARHDSVLDRCCFSCPHYNG
jgi:hypothetical protein